MVVRELDLSDNAISVLNRRYLIKNADGNPIEEPIDLFKRVAKHIDHTGKHYDDYLEIMTSGKFLPNSPTLMNAGRELGQLSACFVLPVEDNMYDIFTTLRNTAMIHKSGGGTGFSFSKLRPSGSFVGSTSGIASGPVSFMRVFNEATEQVKQGGTRRGANMAILRVDHPDILEFISCKSDMTSITNFNISVAITDKFMQALPQDGQYALIDPTTQQPVGNLNARKVWDKIADNAWKNGDPGVIFIDRMNASKANPVPSLGPLESTNPCGEVPLYSYDSCNLGSINLSKFYRNNQVVWSSLNKAVVTAINFLEGVVEVNNYPLPEINKVSRSIRRIGLGVMGWADLLYKMNISYDSLEAIRLAEEVMKFISEAADHASIHLGVELGNFEKFEESIYKGGVMPDEVGKFGMMSHLRNATRTTIAPTGTISIIAGCSGGIEPIFGLAFRRRHYIESDPNKLSNLLDVNKEFEKVAKKDGFYSDELITYLLEGGSLKDRDDVPQGIKNVFVTSHDISPEWHIKMQAAFQKHTDNAVSKTINFPESATVHDVKKSYMQAYDSDCLGITIYRNNSRDNQVLTHEKQKEGIEEQAERIATNAYNRRKLPNERHSITHKFKVGDQEGYFHVGLYDDGSPGEIFVTISKEGSTVSGLMDTIAILMSLSLQYGVPLEHITQKLKGASYEPAGFTENEDIRIATSITDYIARWFEHKFVINILPEESIVQKNIAEVKAQKSGNMCPECGIQLYYSEGCLTCMTCGYSKC